MPKDKQSLPNKWLLYTNQYLRNTFGFSYKELRGFWVILLAMPTLLALPYILAQLFVADFTQITKQEQQKADKLLAQLEVEEKRLMDSLQKAQNMVYFPFNPNQTDSIEWVKLGIKPRLAATIVHFIEKGGTFRTKNDLLKIRGFEEKDFDRLAPYIQLPEKITYTNKRSYPKKEYKSKNFGKDSTSQQVHDYFKKEKIDPFDLNTADTTQLCQIKGIGQKTAQAIIKYRQRLGGFVKYEQLAEVFILKNNATVLERIQQSTYISTDKLQKIALNTADYNTLKAHPYIGSKLAYGIINYRKKHGLFKDVNELRKIKNIDEAILEQLLPYISLE